MLSRRLEKVLPSQCQVELVFIFLKMGLIFFSMLQQRLLLQVSYLFLLRQASLLFLQQIDEAMTRRTPLQGTVHHHSRDSLTRTQRA